MPSYLTGLFENLMEGGEDAASTAMAVKVKGEQGGGEMADRQTDQGSVQIQEHGAQIHTATGGRCLQASVVFCYGAFEIRRFAFARPQKTTREETPASARKRLRSSGVASCWETEVTDVHAGAPTGGTISHARTSLSQLCDSVYCSKITEEPWIAAHGSPEVHDVNGHMTEH